MKRQLSLVLALVMILGSFSSVFAAVSVDQSAVTVAENFLKAEGVLEGDDGNVAAMSNLNLKRRDAVVLVSRLLGEQEAAEAFPSGDLTFKDLTDDYYNGFIAWSVAKEIIVGHDAETFGFNEEMTAQQFATVLLRVLGYEEEEDVFPVALEMAEELGLLIDMEVENTTIVKRGMMALMAFNALYVDVNGTGKTLADTLDIVMPEREVEEEPKATELKVEKVYTENLAEVVVELSNADLVSIEDALLNPANYRLEKTDASVKHVHLDGDNVVLTLVPYGKVEDQKDVKPLVKGKTFDLTIRNIHPKINRTEKKILAVDNAIPEVVSVDFMGDYGIKVTTSEPIANPLERNFRLDSRTAMIVEQYGRDIILTPYHGKAFDKDAVELTIDQLEDFARYTSVRTVENMSLSTDDALPVVEKTYRSGSKLVVHFDRDVYDDSVGAYENRRVLGNASFVERRVPFYAKEANKVDTNVVEYIFEREIPRGMEVVVEGVANHFNKSMEKDVRVPEEYKDDYAPVVISTNHNVSIKKDGADEATLVAMTKEDRKKELDKGFPTTEPTTAMTILFDKDIAQFAKDANGDRPVIDVKDFFTLYELDITKRGETQAELVDIVATVKADDKIELTFKGIKVNNTDRDYDYVLEVRNLSDLNGNRMDREYLDFVVGRQSDKFDVEIAEIRKNTYFNRRGVEIVLKFNYAVNKEEASNAKNYYLDNELAVDEAIVERDGKTVSLIVYDKDDKAALVDAYKVLEISPRVEQLASPWASVQTRYWDLATETKIEDKNVAIPEGDVKVNSIEIIQANVTGNPAVEASSTGIALKAFGAGTADKFELKITVDGISTTKEYTVIDSSTPGTTDLADLVDQINADELGVLASINGTELDIVAVEAIEGMVIDVSGNAFDSETANVPGVEAVEDKDQLVAVTFEKLPEELKVGMTVKFTDSAATKVVEGKVTNKDKNVLTITVAHDVSPSTFLAVNDVIDEIAFKQGSVTITLDDEYGLEATVTVK